MSALQPSSADTIPGFAARRMRVIVLDDDEYVRHVVMQVLRRRSYDVVGFADATSCCAFANSGARCPCKKTGVCADVLITDIKMPGLDGLAFLDALSASKCRIAHRAVMSAFWTADSLDRARHHGCRIFVKPVGVLEIDRWLATVERLVDYDAPLVDHYRG